MPADSPPPPSTGTSAGRGVLYIAFAKLYFMVAGLVVVFKLPGLLNHAAWGSYSFVNSLVSPVNNVLNTGTIQSVSRFSAQEPDKARRVQNAGLRMHLVMGLPLALIYIAAAPAIGWVFSDASKVAPVALGGLILGGNAFYTVFVGTANGMHQFHKQAGFDITFATLRSIGLIGMAMLGLGVVGVMGGWVVAVGLILVISAIGVGLPGRIAKQDRLPVKPMLKFFLHIAVYLALFNMVMFVDTWILKFHATAYYDSHATQYASSLDQVVPWAKTTVGYHPQSSQLADVQVGYYAAVQNLARLSYQAIIAATFVVFPLVSRSTFTDDKDTTRRYIEVTVRYSLIFAAAIAVAMAANPTAILGIVYAPDYAQIGGPALALLALGNIGFSVFAIAGTILNGAGFTLYAQITAGITLALAAVANFIAIPLALESGHVIEVAAGVTGGAMVVGAVITGLVVRKQLGAFLPLLSLARIAMAGAIAIAVGRVVPVHGKLMALVVAALVAVVFLVVLVVTRELGKRDLEAIKAVRRKRAPGGEA
ncbi:MAG: oligosaccharide flippase family protein [Kofleriaceae bacterium]